MGISSTVIHHLTGVPRSKVDAGELTALSALFDTVMQTASAVGSGTSSVVSDIQTSNEGAALDAYTSSMATSIEQLQYLGEKAEATRVAHQSAADSVTSAQDGMEAACVSAARTLAQLLVTNLPPQQKQRIWDAVINTARRSLTKITTAATSNVKAAYDGILPISLISGLGEGHKRGTVPPEVADAYADLTPEERMEFLENVIDDFTSDWPEEDKPEVIFYSTQEPLPPGTQPVPEGYDPDKWEGYNGVRVGDEIYLNYDIGVGDDPDTGRPPPPTLMSTAVHEAQHVDQGRMRDEYDALSQSDIDAIKSGRIDDPFVERGSTIDEVERFRIDYEPAGTPGYTHQPVEVDARRGGTEYLDNKTPDELMDLMP